MLKVKKCYFCVLCASLFVSFTYFSSALADSLYEVNNQLPTYEPIDLGTDAKLHSVGSDSMSDLVDMWVKAYRGHHPDLAIDVLSRGSSFAAAALIDGRADVGPMVRPMKEPELDEFRLKYGFEPTMIRTAIAGVSVYVSKSNPIKSISFKQLDAIFSDERRRGAHRFANLWSDIGVRGDFGKRTIAPMSILSTAYPHTFFKQQVLIQGGVRSDVRVVTDTSALLNAVNENSDTIGFGRIMDIPSGVSALSVSRGDGDEAYAPTLSNVLSGNYPLGRFFNVYIVRSPGEELDLAAKDFLRFVLSKQGQQLVVEKGLIPLPFEIVKTELEKLRR